MDYLKSFGSKDFPTMVIIRKEITRRPYKVIDNESSKVQMKRERGNVSSLCQKGINGHS